MAKLRSACRVLCAPLVALMVPVAMMAVPPIQVYTVPWVPAQPAVPHYSWSGKTITLKGTANIQDNQSGTIMYDWNPGDGGTHCTGVVTNMYSISCSYTYTGTPGQEYNAVLTVYDSTTSNGGSPPVYSNSGSASYYTELYNPPPNLPVEVNAAIDAGLWYLHNDMTRYTSVSVATLTLTNGGSGYESDGSTVPVVSFTGCSTSPTATAVVDNGGPITAGIITSITLNSGGSGCVDPVTVTITDPLQATAGSINGATFTVTSAGVGGELYYFYLTAPTTIYDDGTDTYAYFNGAGNTGNSAYGYAYINTTNGGVGGLAGSIYMYNNGGGYVNPVAVSFTDYYCQDGYYSYYESYNATYALLANGYEYGGTCLTGATATVQAYPNTYGTGATATVTLTAPVSTTTPNIGDWSTCFNDHATNCFSYPSGITAANCTAFEVSGHLEGGPATDPYTDDVSRCLKGVYNQLQSISIPSSKTNTFGTFNPDSNGNGLGVTINGQSEDMYQLGMLMDSLVATGTPNQAASYGTLSTLTHPGGGPYTYGDTVADMSDWYVYCETDANGGTSGIDNEGSWRYSCNSGQDNSVAQWASIGMIGARRNFGTSLPADALDAQVAWLGVSQAQGFTPNGYFGYTSSSPLWGPFADTPSGMVQLALNGIGRSMTATPTQWDYAETFMRDNFDSPQVGNSEADLKDYYYGMFSFTKSMLLHDNSGTGIQDHPIQYLQSLDNSGTYPQIDWYAAQNGTYGGTDTSNGVARTLISGTPANSIAGQTSDGSWYGHSSVDGDQDYFETAWAIIMLNHTVFKLVPTACATYSPNPAIDGQQIQLNGQCSTDQNPNATITTWQWDVSGIAPYSNYTLTGVKVNATLTAPASCTTFPCIYPVGLQVTDSAGNSATTIVDVTINAPTGVQPPAANAGGPYSFCPNTNSHGVPLYTPWDLNGSLSTQSNGYVITGYNWSFDCTGTYNSWTGAQPRVDTGANNIFNTAPGQYGICLQVSNNTGIAQDTYGYASSTITINATTAAPCSHCVTTQSAKAKNFTPGVQGSAQLYWIDTNSAAFPIDHYNIYRSSNASFSPSIQVAGANGKYPAIPAQAGGGEQLDFVDGSIPAPSTTPYYYRIAPATVADVETCASPLTLSIVVGGRT